MISNISFFPDFKYVVFSRLNKLLGLRYIVGKFQMSRFYPNFNRSKILSVTLDMCQTVHECIV